MYTFDIDGPVGNALFDALMYTDYDENLHELYAAIGLAPGDNNTMEIIE